MRRIAWALTVVVSVVLAAPPVGAVLTSSLRTSTQVGANNTKFTIPYHFTAKDQIKVTKTTIATGIGVVLTQGVDYTVTLPVGSTAGYINTSVAVAATHSVTIERNIPLTQTTSFTSQGNYLPKTHEDAFDKAMMAIQQLAVGAVDAGDITTAITNHSAAADPHTGYALLLGRASGQHLRGGTAAGENLQLSSTFNATKGKVLLGSGGTELVVDDANNRVGVLTATPGYALDVNGDAAFGATTRLTLDSEWINSPSDSTSAEFYISATDSVGSLLSAAKIILYGPSHSSKPTHVEIGGATIKLESDTGTDRVSITSSGIVFGADLDVSVVDQIVGGPGALYSSRIYGGTGAAASLTLNSTFSGTKGFINFGTVAAVDEANTRLGIGTTTPTRTLEVRGVITGRAHTATITSQTLTANTECGAVFLDSTNGGLLQLPLRAAANDGCTFTLINSAATGTAQISVTPNVVDSILGACGSTVFAGTAGNSARNTLASQRRGDRISAAAIGTGQWWITECEGGWGDVP